jgi:hypothetical protein
VDISSYPAPIPKAYKLLAEKCSACHTTARALNVTMSPDSWNMVVKQMAAKSTPRISVKQIHQILQFLLYDEVRGCTSMMCANCLTCCSAWWLWAIRWW